MNRLISVLAVLLMFAASSQAQTTTTYNVVQGVGNNGCYVSATNPCWGSLVTQDGMDAGVFVFYVRNNPDGTFTNTTVYRYAPPNGSLTWSATDFTGTWVPGTPVGPALGSYNVETASGSLSTTALDGSSVSVQLDNIVVTAVKHKEGGGRVGIRTVVTYYLTAGTFTETVSEPVPRLR